LILTFSPKTAISLRYDSIGCNEPPKQLRTATDYSLDEKNQRHGAPHWWSKFNCVYRNWHL